MEQVIDLERSMDEFPHLASVQDQVLEAIERELATMRSDYADTVLRLAQAHAWLSGRAALA
jgi:hypothetical protein